MKKLLVLTIFLFLSKVSAQTWKTEDQYIQQFAQYAVEEMEKYHIPASITLAQGLLETGGGQSRLAQLGNNHFGIKCKEEWTGKSMTHTDDAPNECFRVYDDPRQSYEDHSIFLTTRKHYQRLFDLDPKDYRGWAYGLKKAGYATNPRYPSILIGKIEKYRLFEFDQMNSKEVVAALMQRYPGLQSDQSFLAKLEAAQPKKQEIKQKVEEKPVYSFASAAIQTVKTDAELLKNILVRNHANGDRKYIIMPADASLSFVAQKFGLAEAKLMEWNDLVSTKLKRNDILFLESKGNRGNVETYQALAGESLHEIAQKFAIKLSKLCSKNRMDPNDSVHIGQVIYLQDRKPRS